MNAKGTSEIAVVDQVSKSYGPVKGLDGVSLTIRPGEILGLLGPNGSGKSTLMKMLMGLVRPDRGRVNVLGLDPTTQPVEVRSLLGYVPEAPRLYEFLTGIEYLDFVADIRKLSSETKLDRINRYVNALGLTGRENDLISGYSLGMKQKVAITAALLAKPRLLVLDEPLNGLDPRSARIVKDLLRDLASEGVSTLFSTHILEIAEAICNRIIVLHQGTVLSEGSVGELREKAGLPGSTLEEVFLKMTGTEDLRSIVEALTK